MSYLVFFINHREMEVQHGRALEVVENVCLRGDGGHVKEVRCFASGEDRMEEWKKELRISWEKVHGN